MSAAQLSLFGREPPRVEAGFSCVRRTQLDASSWLELAPSFVAGDAQLLDELRARMQWRQERRVMYEREVDVPRLYAVAPDDGALHPTLAGVANALSLRYTAHFERVSFALYRDGRDSVAWHRDKMPRDRPTLVAILSLGQPRRLLVRPHGGGASRSFDLGGGDLFVMGGFCQARWEHCVPKRREAAPRLSCMFRYVYDDAAAQR